jgi:regulator of cell morphogenesis and NO signaling
MNFTAETKVKEIAVAHPGATQILEKAGVDYCCGGSKSLHDACAHAGVSTEEIMARLAENQADVGPADSNWVSAPLGDLTEHIREKHHRYVREAIRRDLTLLEKVTAKHAVNHAELRGIQNLFIQVGREMTMHMQKEEQILFPYIEALEHAANGEAAVEPPFFQTVRNPVHAMMEEHDAAAALVSQIREASSAYTPPADACASYQALYRDLQDFEADLHQHVHLENNILFPRAVEMEASIV